MIIGERLRALREEKKFSQGDIEKRTGLLRCYISRVENGHTVPAVETLEKFARALEVPMYQLFYDGEERQNCRIFRNGGCQRRTRGAIRVRMHARWRSSANFLVGPIRATGDCSLMAQKMARSKVA